MSDQHWSQTMLPRERIEQLENANRDLREENERVRQANIHTMDVFEDMKAAKEKAEARVAGIKQIIAVEPELPGEMPEEMWQAFVDAINEGDRAFVMTALRVAVKETKDCILERIREAERAGGEQ